MPREHARDKRYLRAIVAAHQPKRIATAVQGEWTGTSWDDGSDQVTYGKERRFSIERIKHDVERPDYFIVDRGESGDETHAWTLYAPVVSGPFTELDAAKAALLVFLSARGRR